MYALFLRLLRLLLVKDRSFSDDLKNRSFGVLIPAEPSYKSRTSTSTFTHLGKVPARSGGRFILLSFRDFASIMLDKERDEITDEDLKNLSEGNKGGELAKRETAEAFIEHFQNNKQQYITNFKAQCANGKNKDVIATLIEEQSHNTLIRDTPLFVILNSLTIYYRICSCYLGYHRCVNHNKPLTKDKELEVSAALINTYFIRRWIFNFAYPIVEAAYHYNSSNDDEINQYGEDVKNWCSVFNEIENGLNSHIADKEKIKSLMTRIQQVMLAFPYIYVLTHVSKINFKAFQAAFQSLEIDNERFIKQIKNKLNGQFDVTGFEDFLKAEYDKRVSNSKLDQEFLASLLYLGTERKEDFIPKDLNNFLAKHIIKCKNKKALYTMLSSGTKVNNAYRDMPPVLAFGNDDQFFDIDPSMEIFDTDSFIIAQNSFEPTLAGENGYVGLGASPYCRPFLIHALYFKAVSEVYFSDPVNKQNFIDSFDLCFDAKPYAAQKKEDMIHLLGLFFDEAEKTVPRDRDVTKDFAKQFEKSISELYNEVELLDDDLKERFYSFCSINYAHGF